MNTVILIGRLTADPELRYTGGQMAVCGFTLAVDRISKDGEKKADFPRVNVFGKQAENVNQYLHKGSKCAVLGSIHTDSYEKDGRRVYVTDVNAQRVEFLDSKQEQPQTEQSDPWTPADASGLPWNN